MPIVAFDIDGTMAEYHNPLFRLCLDYFGVDHEDANICQWDGSGNFEDYIGITQAQYREAKLAFRQGGYKRYVQEYPMVCGIARKLKQRGYELWITTTRPWNRLDSADPDTRFWLDSHMVPYDHLLYDDHKYPKLTELVDKERVKFILEDLPEMYAEGLAIFGPDVMRLVERPHNASTFWPRQDIRAIAQEIEKWPHVA